MKTENFDVDTTALVTITVSYDYPDRSNHDGKAPNVTLVSPNGTIYNSKSSQYDEDTSLKTVMFYLENTEVTNTLYCLRKFRNS